MDTRTRTTSPTADDEHAKPATPPPMQDKISAYYSLVFPHFTFYIQTLSITIGRRCVPNTASSSTATETAPVDVDLGALKSVSRLHAKIEYDQEEDRFVLVVIGRNGAWVDGVWSGSGTRAPLGERSQIQIASRTFHFVLPPPPPPEDTPSPSSQSSANRLRSPSVDITSISPPSSQPSHSPVPAVSVKLAPPSPEPQKRLKVKPKAKANPPRQAQAPSPPPPPPQLPNSNSIGQSSKANAKKRKKADMEAQAILERPKPEDMPPKPPFTYAQLIYRAIKEIDGKATLQEICNWITKNHEYYRYADGAWMSSVRHNLSSSRAFLKMERCGGDRGKGFFWSIDEAYSHALEEQESKAKQAAQGILSSGAETLSKTRKRDKGAPLEPALKRSVKGEVKGQPLPPPLTSVPLQFKTTSGGGGTTAKDDPAPPNYSASHSATNGMYSYNQGFAGQNPYGSLMTKGGTTSVPSTVAPAGGAAQAGVVPDVIIPIILGPIPPTHADYAPKHANNSAKEGYMILHERTLILDPDIFSELTKETLERVERLGAREALGYLTNHMIKALKERRAKGRRGKKARGVSPMIVVDGESDGDERAAKKRKL